MKNAIVITLCAASLTLFAIPTNADVRNNERIEISLSVFVPCAAGGVGEIVDLSGSIHALLTFTINGNNVSGVMHFQPQGISGTGETTGLKYQATGVTSTSFKMSLQDGETNRTFINRFDIIGQGPNDNFRVHETAHITFNADGTVNVTFDDFGVECK